MTTDEQDTALEAYTARWNAFRRKTMVMTAPELLELVGLLREVDAEVLTHWYDTLDGWPDIRARLEKLLGLHPGELDTKRRVCVESAEKATPREGDRT